MPPKKKTLGTQRTRAKADKAGTVDNPVPGPSGVPQKRRARTSPANTSPANMEVPVDPKDILPPNEDGPHMSATGAVLVAMHFTALDEGSDIFEYHTLDEFKVQSGDGTWKELVFPDGALDANFRTTFHTIKFNDDHEVEGVIFFAKVDAGTCITSAIFKSYAT